MNIQQRLKNLKELVEFKQDEFIFVQIFQRRKDNPDLELSVKRLKSYSFYSWEELEKQIPRIEEICDLSNARAYIRLNKQNAVDVSLRCITEMAENLRKGNASNNKGVWDSVSGQAGSKDWWVLDLDTEHLHLKLDIANELSWSYEERKNKLFGEIIYFNETKSGVHVICKPFDTRILDKYNKELSSKGIQTIQIQRDANTILYIGNENKKN
jgi:hypothetical protein